MSDVFKSTLFYTVIPGSKIDMPELFMTRNMSKFWTPLVTDHELLFLKISPFIDEFQAILRALDHQYDFGNKLVAKYVNPIGLTLSTESYRVSRDSDDPDHFVPKYFHSIRFMISDTRCTTREDTKPIWTTHYGYFDIDEIIDDNYAQMFIDTIAAAIDIAIASQHEKILIGIPDRRRFMSFMSFLEEHKTKK